jgi:hypothetical protein
LNRWHCQRFFYVTEEAFDENNFENFGNCVNKILFSFKHLKTHQMNYETLIQACKEIHEKIPDQCHLVLGYKAFQILQPYIKTEFDHNMMIVRRIEDVEIYVSFSIPGLNYMMLTSVELDKFTQEEAKLFKESNKQNQP